MEAEIQASREIPAQILEQLQRKTAGLGRAFTEAGHEIALVGGPVRDAMLGKLPTDLDLTTSARPEETQTILDRWADTTWDVGRAYGTIGARKGEDIFEVTTFRSDHYQRDSRKPEVNFGDTLDGDLWRRDFTVNAMALRLPTLELVDPTGGAGDLEEGILKTPIAPEESFGDDPLRIMRAARFTGQLGFDVDYQVMCAMQEMRQRLEIVSRERIRAELERLIISPYPRRGIELMVHTGVADIVLPEVAGLVSTVDEHKRHKDVYEHTLTVVEQAMDLETGPDGPVPAPDFILRFAALMHDVGKPATRRFEPNGTVSFHHHEIVGAKMTRKRMKALHFDKATIEAVSNLVALHLRFHGYGEAAWSDSAVRRYVADAGDLLERLHRLTRADCTTRNRRKANFLSSAYDDLEARIAALREQEELDAIRPDLDGDQIMEILGLRPSRAVKIARDYLLELRMERGPLGEEAARQALLDWWASDDVRALAEEYQAQQAHWEAKVAEKKARKAAEAQISLADSAVSQAERYVQGRRGAIDLELRSTLNNAETALSTARRSLEDDPEAASTHAMNARALADSVMATPIQNFGGSWGQPTTGNGSYTGSSLGDFLLWSTLFSNSGSHHHDDFDPFHSGSSSSGSGWSFASGGGSDWGSGGWSSASGSF